MRHSLLSILLTLLLLAPPSARAEEEWARPYAPYLPGTEPLDERGERTIAAVRVLLGSECEPGTARPLPGARVACFEEDSDASSPGARLLAETQTDEFGFATVLGPLEFGYHWHFDAPGVGVAYTYSGFSVLDEEYFVEPGGDLDFRVLDPFGRPLPAARVEYYLGCPHSPSARSGVTGEDGLITLAGLDGRRTGRLWITAPGISAGPYELPERYVREPLLDEEDGPPVLITDPARSVSGVVLDTEGDPVAGAVVRSAAFARGPVTVTDAEGRFLLHGVSNGRPLLVYHPEPESFEVPGCIVGAFHEKIPLRLVIRPDRATAMAEGEPRHPVTLLAWPEGTPVRLTRLSDGFTVRGRTGEGLAGTSAHHLECIFTADLPPGDYRAEAGGGFSRAALVTATLRVPVPGGAPVRLETSPQPELWVADVDRSWLGRVSLRIPGEERLCDAFELNDRVHLPGEGPATILFRSPRPYLVAVEDRSDRLFDRPEDYRPAYPIPPEPHRLRFWVKSSTGASVEPSALCGGWWVEDLPEVEPGVFEIRTHLAGPVRVTISADGHEPESLDLDLPGLGARVIDGGEVELRPVVEREAPPSRPVGAIRVRVFEEGGGPIPAVAYADAGRALAPAGTCEFTGLTAGPHIVIVGARGHLGEVRRVVLDEGESREITVRLPPR